MSNSLQYALSAVFILINLFAFLTLIVSKRSSKQQFIRQSKILNQIANALANRDFFSTPNLRYHKRNSEYLFGRIRDYIRIPGEAIGDEFSRYIEGRLLGQGTNSARIAASLLVLLPRVEQARIARKVLEKTKWPWTLLLRIASICIDSGYTQDEDIEHLFEGFQHAPFRLQERLANLLQGCPERTYLWFRNRNMPNHPLAKRIGVTGIPCCSPEEARSYIIPLLNHPSEQIYRNAALQCARFHPWIFTQSPNQALFQPEVRRIAIHSLLKGTNEPSWDLINGWLSFPELTEVLTTTMQPYIRKRPELLSELLRYFQQSLEKTPADQWNASHLGFSRALGLARIIEPSLPYVYLHGQERIASFNQEDLELLLRVLIVGNRNSAVIRLANALSNQEALNRLKPTFTKLIQEHPDFARDCQQFLSPRVKDTLGITVNIQRPSVPRQQLTLGDKIFLGFLGLFTISLIPSLFNIFVFQGILAPGLQSSLLFYQNSFIWYSLIVNLSYLLFLGLALLGARQKNNLHRSEEPDFFSKPGMLPSVSIIVPGYNEEQSILQSVQSLLNLNYPDFEVIVVNDGSKDRTLAVLKDGFDLQPANRSISDIVQPNSGGISTAPIHGVFQSSSVDRLLVIDKVNGGKADSLNAGILHAQGEYVVCIDSDSLLEPHALLHLMRSTLDSDVPTMAIGGNIIPVNGCSVSKGSIRDIHTPENRLALIQTLEYFRAFIIGRMGWAKLGSLLIISGAFGAFQRKVVIEIGGYLTGSGSQHLDTVGEDMELVVRLRKHLYAKGIHHRVQYVHTANCWTEVPEQLSSLLLQRDRWNRGLMEVITVHRDMIFRRKYGVLGWFALPYFYLFELLGPFLETGGYISAFLALILGIANIPTIILLFSISLGLGTFISMMSLIVADKNVLYFRGRDFRRLLGASVLENFGYRQLFGMQRVWSFIRYLFKNQGWKQPPRKGFMKHTGTKS
jgi:cellulose synthase/poly-beta-1,6-N-acetylglucosamine synthase-like glycosyltransferase